MHSTGTGQPVETQDVFFWRLAGRSAPTGLAIVHWIGCINAIKMSFFDGEACLDDNLKGILSIHLKLSKYIHSIKIWKS